MKLKVAQISDVHYSDKYLDEVGPCMEFAVDSAIDESCDLAIISGDLFDHKLDAHSHALHHCLSQIEKLLEKMPVIVLQGTLSHDIPGTINIFKTIHRNHQLFVVSEPTQILLGIGSFHKDHLTTMWSIVGYIPPIDDVINLTLDKNFEYTLITLFPPINKGDIAASSGLDNVNSQAGSYVSNFLKSIAENNDIFCRQDKCTIFVSHGTVNGCTTEHGVPMHGNDHEFTVGSLFASEADAIMLGHIHKFQSWTQDDRTIAYPGSLGCLHYGEVGPKGFLIWEIEPGKSMPTLIETPAKQLLDIDFDGEPDMDEIVQHALSATGKHVRIRYCVDEDRRHVFDISAIKALFESAAAVKIEVSVSAIVRTRTQGITRKNSIHEKIDMWAETVEVEPDHIKTRLDQLMAYEPDAIVEQILS